MRRHGPFEPHRFPLDEMECTTMPGAEQRLASRWEAMVSANPEIAPAMG